MRPGPIALLSRILASPPRLYAITVVTNEGPRSEAVIAKTRAAEADTWRDAEIDLSWPEGVYSLSHVALPIPADDAVYGRIGGRPPLGAIEARGERNVLVISSGQLMRLRYNPFFAYVSERIRAALETH